MNIKIEYIHNFLLLFLITLVIAGCSTVLGPPDSESEDMNSPEFGTHNSRYDLFFDGRPNPGMFTTDGAYFLWRDGNVWHVRIARADRFRFDSSVTPVFTGEVKVDKGIVVNLVKHQVDISNNVDQGKDGIAFRFKLRNDVEGFDFTVRPFGIRYCVTFDLKIDQKNDPAIVHLGKSMFVPNTLPIMSCVP